MSLPNPLASRRTTMTAGLAGLLALHGCDDDAGGAAPPADPTTEPPADADAALVEQVQEQLTAALADVDHARRTVPDLRQRLRPLADLHRAHLAVLDTPEGLLPPSSRPSVSAGQVRAAETALQRQLVDAAVRAESGTLAKLLASMAAAVAQHLAVLA